MNTKELEVWSNSVADGICKDFGPTTRENVAARVNALLVITADICAMFPKETKETDSRAWEMISIYGRSFLETTLGIELAKKVHEARCHPDFEYKSIEWPLKYEGESFPPTGKGWQRNIYHENGVSKYASSMDHHWMRLKTMAERDDVNINELPELLYKKVSLNEYLGMLRGAFCKGYMPSSTSTRTHNSKPTYVEDPREILDVCHLNGIYQLETLRLSSAAYKAENLSRELFGENIFYDDKILSKQNSLFVIEVNDFKIITILKNDKTFITTRRQDGTYQNWQVWYDFLELPLDRQSLRSILEENV